MKNVYQNHKEFFLVWTKDSYFSANSAIKVFQRQHENHIQISVEVTSVRFFDCDCR